jgi:hypothetical protein
VWPFGIELLAEGVETGLLLQAVELGGRVLDKF